MATSFPVQADTNPAVQNIDKLIAQLIKLGKQAGMTQGDIDKMVSTTVKAKTQGVQSMDSLGKSMGGINDIAKKGTELIAAYFAVDKIKDFVGEVVRVTAEFQRLEAVLTNTLGSNSMARAALMDIQKLAAVTPFSVKELSDSFVKLANRGVKPTMDEMRKMGDLAAVLGKPFEQVVEALLDINNQERWKEIGVKAETLGNKVKLSFKGMTYEVDRTVQGVTDAAVKLGELEGVAGSMSAISKTLGGKISNLGDAWDTFLKTVGQGNNGVLSGTVNLLSQAVSKATELLSTDSQKRDTRSLGVYTEQRKKVEDLYKNNNSIFQGDLQGAQSQAIIDLQNQLVDLNKKEKDLNHEGREIQKQMADYVNIFAPEYILKEQQLKDKKAEIIAVQLKYNDLVNDGQLAILEYVAAEQKDYDLKKKTDAEMARAQAQKDEIERLKNLKKSLDDLAEAMANVDAYYNKHVKPIATYNPTLKGVNDKNIVTSIPGAQGSPELNPDKSSVDPYDLEGQKRKQSLGDFKNYSIQAMGEIFAFNLQGIQNEMTALQNRYNYDIGLAGNNAERKAKLAADYNKQMNALQNKQAAAQKEQAIFGILVNQGPAVANAIKDAPFPINLGIGLVVAAMFASLIANTKSVNTPRFAKGVFDLDGYGTDTSDNIPAWLSPGESVTPAKKTRKFKDVLQPMIENENFGWTDLHRIVANRMPVLNAPMIVTNAHLRDNDELIGEIRDLKKTVKDKKEFHLNVTKEGMTLLAQEGNEWTKYISKRYRVN